MFGNSFFVRRKPHAHVNLEFFLNQLDTCHVFPITFRAIFFFVYPGASSFQRINIPEALVCACEFQSFAEGRDEDEMHPYRQQLHLPGRIYQVMKAFCQHPPLRHSQKPGNVARQWLRVIKDNVFALIKK